MKTLWKRLRAWYEELLDRPLDEGKRIERRYLIERVLGQGSYGITYLCEDIASGQRCVVKQVRPSKREGEKGLPIFEYETSILAALDHPRIPKLLERFAWRGDLFFAMEYMEGRNVEDWIFDEGAVLSEREALLLVREVLEIVAYLHGQRLVHRDVRIPNVILTEAGPALIDFGLARYLGDKATYVAENLDDYVSEKQIKREVAFRSDFYSLGHFLLFLLYTTYEPPDDVERDWEEELSLTPAVQRMIRKMLQIDSPYESAVELLGDLDAALMA